MLNDRCLWGPLTGVGHYVNQLLASLPEQAPDVEVLAFYRRYLEPRGIRKRDPGRGTSGGLSPNPDAANRQASPRRPRWRNWSLGAYHTAFRLAGRLKGSQLYHEPNHIPCRWHGPVLTTVHDLSVLRHPDWHPADRVRWYERDFMTALPRTSHFITVSAFTRAEMVELLGLPAERISVIPLGPRACFRPRPAEERERRLRALGLPRSYLLFVGTLEPRKNLEGLLAAYALLPAALRRRYPLVVTGMGGWSGEPLETVARRHRIGPDVRITGYVDEDTLAVLYSGARALVWPSWYEGFGLPPLEAMACGTPVITSDRASLPEVVGDAGLLVDPGDRDALADAMRRVVEDDPLAVRLGERGIARSAEFSWARAAQAHAALYRQWARN